VIRALSKGIPVIASEHVGACKHIVNAVNGFTYNPQDLNRLVETIDKLGDDSTVQKLSTAAFELSAESIQTNQRHVDDLVEIYEKVLTGVQAV
jgi:glycosyltransferase involved in cell wall biosynthesis